MNKERQRQISLAQNRASRAWASEMGFGTKPPTFPEISRAPSRSKKNLRCAGRKPVASIPA